KRIKYGRSSEQLDRELLQMQLSIEDLEASLAAKPAELRPVPRKPAEKPVRRPLPEQLPREQIVHENPCTWPSCGGWAPARAAVAGSCAPSGRMYRRCSSTYRVASR